MDLLPAIEAYIERHQLLPYAHAPVVVGVSGGPDSVALLHLLHRLAEQQDFALHVAHLHHGIRGAEADADADFVAAFARQLALPCTIERVDLPALAAAEGLALEEAARRVRYAFFARLAQRLEAPVIAVGHNADDQAETVLMHLLRGAGLSGLRGMLPATPLCDYRLLPLSDPLPSSLLLIRPLLATPRAAIKAYCATYNLETRFDRSNLDTTFFRNRLRHEVLPYLAELNPGIATRLQHLAEVVRADYEILRECVDVA
ncbi:MAG TPA: tRNA lysidine(34) synthetase TilS, partial [Chloroflexi bacterium]|nr:tRNA lysidine(34) synthetase TilS [Chloroflexota bacterium]